MSMAQFWFNFNNAWSGQKYYTEGAIQLFNLVYTSVPILLLGLSELYSIVLYIALQKFVCFFLIEIMFHNLMS